MELLSTSFLIKALIAAQGATALTLDQAIQLAEENSFSVQTAESRVEKANQVTRETRGRLGPQLSSSTTYTRFAEAPPSFGPGPNPIDSTLVQFSLTLPVDVAGTTKKAVRAFRSLAEAERANVLTAKRDLRFNVTQAFFQVLQAQAVAGVAEEGVQRAQERLKNTEAEFRAGARAKVDVLRIETSVKEAEANLIRARTSVELAKASFNNALGRAIDTPVALQDVPNREVTGPDAEPQLVSQAQESRAELTAIRRQQDYLKLAREAQEGGTLPSLSVSLQHQRYIGQIGPFTQRETTLGVVQVAWAIFDSNITRSRVKQARQDEAQAKIQFEQVSLAVSLEVRQARLNVENAVSRYGVAQKQLELARENFRLVSLRFDNAEGIALEVADANTQLTQAQTDLVNAEYDYRIAVAQLRRAVGVDPKP